MGIPNRNVGPSWEAAVRGACVVFSSTQRTLNPEQTGVVWEVQS